MLIYALEYSLLILHFFWEECPVKQIVSQMRRCVEDYRMIEAGDRIAVGVSGGKDSVVTLRALAKLREFYPKPFTVEAITLDMSGGKMDFSPIARLCEEIDVPFHLVESQIFEVIFDYRKEKNPCSLCAKMRRGALHNAMAELGIHKIALGHHRDDAVETFFMSLFYEGRLNCFQPVTYLDRTGVTQIRPLLYTTEGQVRSAVARNSLPVVKNICPADGSTKRQEAKELVVELSQRYPDLKDYIFSAMQRLPLPEWGVLPRAGKEDGSSS